MLETVSVKRFMANHPIKKMTRCHNQYEMTNVKIDKYLTIITSLLCFCLLYNGCVRTAIIFLLMEIDESTAQTETEVENALQRLYAIENIKNSTVLVHCYRRLTMLKSLFSNNPELKAEVELTTYDNGKEMTVVKPCDKWIKCAYYLSINPIDMFLAKMVNLIEFIDHMFVKDGAVTAITTIAMWKISYNHLSDLTDSEDGLQLLIEGGNYYNVAPRYYWEIIKSSWFSNFFGEYEYTRKSVKDEIINYAKDMAFGVNTDDKDLVIKSTLVAKQRENLGAILNRPMSIHTINDMDGELPRTGGYSKSNNDVFVSTNFYPSADPTVLKKRKLNDQ